MNQDILSFEDIKSEKFVIDNILWDINPKDLTEPRKKITMEGIEIRRRIKGYVFYIDTAGDTPMLFLMRHTAMDYGETLALIEEIPQGLLIEAIEENRDKEYFKMYPINQKIKEWLKKEIGI